MRYLSFAAMILSFFAFHSAQAAKGDLLACGESYPQGGGNSHYFETLHWLGTEPGQVFVANHKNHVIYATVEGNIDTLREIQPGQEVWFAVEQGCNSVDTYESGIKPDWSTHPDREVFFQIPKMSVIDNAHFQEYSDYAYSGTVDVR